MQWKCKWNRMLIFSLSFKHKRIICWKQGLTTWKDDRYWWYCSWQVLDISLCKPWMSRCSSLLWLDRDFMWKTEAFYVTLSWQYCYNQWIAIVLSTWDSNTMLHSVDSNTMLHSVDSNKMLSSVDSSAYKLMTILCLY